MRSSQLVGRSRLADLQNRTHEAGRDMDGEAPRFNRLKDDNSKPRVISSFNLFQTPEHIAARMASMLGDCVDILEPSAGLGRLVKAVRKINSTARFNMVDISADCCRELEKYPVRLACDHVTQADFLAVSPDRLGFHDAIIMNPPFHNREDIRHIQHALKFLAPGGVLVGLCMATHHREQAIKPLANHWEVLPAGIFEGTKTQAVLFRIQG